MKKALFLLLAALLISQYSCDDEEDSGCFKLEGVSGKKDCNNRKDKYAYRCCYVKAKGKIDGKKQTKEYCSPIDEENYKKIKDFIKEMEKDGESSDLDIKNFDCNSNYLLISIMSLILLLFL